MTKDAQYEDWEKRHGPLTPDWSDAGTVHEWMNHVPEPIRDMWHTFSDDQKRVLYDWADDLAGREEWE